MNHSTPGLPVHHQLPEFTQTHVHWVRDAIQPSHPLSSFSSCHQSLPASESFPMSQLFILEVKKSKLLEDIWHNPRDQTPKLLGVTFSWTVWLIQSRFDIGEWDGWCVILTQNHTMRLTEHAWWAESSSTISDLSHPSLSTFFPLSSLERGWIWGKEQSICKKKETLIPGSS